MMTSGNRSRRRQILGRFILTDTGVIRVSLLFCACLAAVCHAEDGSPETFDRRIAPLLAENCLSCHSGREPKGGLDLSDQSSALRGGDTGIALAPASLDKSLIWQRIQAGEMPPEHPLAEADRQLIRDWIIEGAVWGTNPIDPFRYSSGSRAGYDWWALQPIRRPEVPQIADVRNPVDAFVRQRLKAAGLEPSPTASSRVIIRRMTFDLLGLPPSPEDVREFEAEWKQDSVAAVERLIARLLDSPHFGERWARHWLDVARFGESQGFERDKLRNDSWHYRDWVIDAFNNDMPYDEFARLQLAGDVLYPDDPNAITATGFLVAGPWDEVGQSQQSKAMKAVVRQDELEDYVGTVSQAFLGLTVNCARCHDHKFDPIRQREYYRLAAALAGVHHGSREVMHESDRRKREEIDEAIRNLQHDIAAKSDEQKTPRDQRVESLEQRKRERERHQSYSVYAAMPAEPEPTWLLDRGNPAQQVEPVTPGGIAAVAGVDAEFGLAGDASDAERRTRLASWITSPQNPLFARVIVNRLWHHHFGTGLVDTPNDFGFNGGTPSHPELLDFLAAELVAADFRLKPIHHLIVSSATWQQESRYRADCGAVDADNRLLWRKSPERLDAETLRDSILAVCGQLNQQVAGPPYRDFETFTNNSQFYTMTDADDPAVYRRTIYRTWIRSGRNHLLDVFDCPDPSTTAPKRSVTTTPLQALTMMNNSFVLRMADRFAERVTAERGSDPVACAERVCELAWGRSPLDSERDAAVVFIRQHGLPAYCRVILNSNELIHVD